MKDVNLSKRMEAVVSMISPQSFDIADLKGDCEAVAALKSEYEAVAALKDSHIPITIADVGCDHAYVSIALINRNLADHVIAMDVRTGPLDIARSNVAEAGLSDKIDLRLGDGLERLLPGEVDVIIIAGMGGLLIKGILERGADILRCETKRPVLILQPQSDLKEIRMFLHSHAYHIVCERMLLEEGKYYTVIKAVPVQASLQEREFTEEYREEEWEYGKYNLVNQSDVLRGYLQNEEKVLECIKAKVENALDTSGDESSASTIQRLHTVKQELAINQKAQRYYEGG